MNLRYINLDLDRENYGNKYGYKFFLNTRYICNYLSKTIRKLKYTTDSTFNMISIRVSNELFEPKIVPFDVLAVGVLFDKERYELMKKTENCSYYLELLEEGFRKASEFKEIPLKMFLNLIDEFKSGGCKNEWLHKRKKFKEQDLEVALNCEFTTKHFQLVATISQISTEKELIKGIVLRTEPDEVLYDKMFKDILIENNKIVITDASDSPRIIMKKEDALNGFLKFDIRGDKEIKEMLSYGLW